MHACTDSIENKIEEENNRTKQNVDRYMKNERNSARIKICCLTTQEWYTKQGKRKKALSQNIKPLISITHLLKIRGSLTVNSGRQTNHTKIKLTSCTYFTIDKIFIVSCPKQRHYYKWNPRLHYLLSIYKSLTKLPTQQRYGLAEILRWSTSRFMLCRTTGVHKSRTPSCRGEYIL